MQAVAHNIMRSQRARGLTFGLLLVSPLFLTGCARGSVSALPTQAQSAGHKESADDI